MALPEELLRGPTPPPFLFLLLTTLLQRRKTSLAHLNFEFLALRKDMLGTILTFPNDSKCLHFPKERNSHCGCRDVMWKRSIKRSGPITVNKDNHVIMTAFTYTLKWFYLISNLQSNYIIANVKTTRTTIVFVYIIHEFNFTLINPERLLF